MARTECTQAQWQALNDVNPSHFPGYQRPVEKVSFEDTLAYVAGLNATITLPPGWEWSLPTEAQWEYACRAGSTTPFSHGEVLISDLANFNGDFPYNARLFSGTNLGHTVSAASYPPNAWNLYDMHGNVFEWCLDHWSGYPPLQGGDDPIATSGPDRVIRGGAWNFDGQDCRSASRRGKDPELASANIGFRVAVVRITR